jgi:hypothetical protein
MTVPELAAVRQLLTLFATPIMSSDTITFLPRSNANRI